jgi:hypothetical protein
VSLLLPAIDPAAGPALSGWDVLTRGWRGTSSGVLSWWANPALALALIAMWLRPGRSAAVLACVALLLALSSFIASVTAGWFGARVPDFGFGTGFYVWLAAHFGAVAASGISASPPR